MAERAQLAVKKPEVKSGNSAIYRRKSDHSPSLSLTADRILFLQRTIGNQAVQRLIKSGALQAKLRIGQPGDKYEQEADRVADAVMRMPEPGGVEEETLQAKPPVEMITPSVQRQVEEEELQRQSIEEDEEELQAKATSVYLSEVTPNLESRIHSLKGGGQPLPESDRAYFEPRFGRDFSQVRVHTDTRAVEAARAVNARAFTVGQDVVFGTGMYVPGASGGRRLMAHELAHVVQQSEEPAVSPMKVTDSSELAEIEAEVVAQKIVAGKRVAVVQLPAVSIARQSATAGKTKPSPKKKQEDVPLEVQVKINEQRDDLRTWVFRYWMHYYEGLNAFAVAMNFASEQEAEYKLSDALFTETGKFLINEALGKLGTVGKIATFTKSLIDAGKLEKERSSKARGEVTIKKYINDLAADISKKRGLVVNEISDKADDVFKKGYMDNGRDFIDKDLPGAITRFRESIPSMSRFHQLITEQFAMTGEKTKRKRPSGRLYFGLTVRRERTKTGKIYHLDRKDDAWILRTSAPKPENIADSLKASLKRQGKKPYQSDLPKRVSLRAIQVQPWKDVSRYVQIRFKKYPYYSFHHLFGPLGPVDLDFVQDVWIKVSSVVLEVEKIVGSVE